MEYIDLAIAKLLALTAAVNFACDFYSLVSTFLNPNPDKKQIGQLQLLIVQRQALRNYHSSSHELQTPKESQ